MGKKGTISVHTENIFPIIKKWLYSDKDIFLRELVSNACDAISKFEKLKALGHAEQAEGDKPVVRVILNPEQKTIEVVDNGIGMTEEEVEKYITQVAFSGAEEFIEKYKNETDEANKIIGHFGLGFYSAFMVAERVEINTLSYLPGAKAVHWMCDGGTEYTVEEGNRNTRGTQIILHVGEDSTEFLGEFELKRILEKYCGFLPYEIYFETVKPEEAKPEPKEGEEPAKPEEPKPVNDIHPLWTKSPKDCTDEEYIAFYQKVFMDFTPPLFWIHLNVEYPFHLQGILYFPKLRNEMENFEGQIKLYNNQVYVADNIKEVIPDFLLLLKGCIDCPDLPLNVSRSFLQNDGYVRKVSSHITKKVADKLNDLSKNHHEDFEKYWADINPFIKFGCLRDEKFYDRVKDIIIFKNLDGSYITLKELEESKEDKIFYVSDEAAQAQYIKLFQEQGQQAILLNNVIDNHFISFLEMKLSGKKFQRIDSDLSDALTDGEAETDEALMKEVTQALGMPELKVELRPLKSDQTPAVILLSEQSRRMLEMAKMYGQADMMNMFKEENTFVLNTSNALVKKLKDMKNEDDKKLILNHLYDLAMIAHKPLSAEQMTGFINRSTEILSRIV